MTQESSRMISCQKRMTCFLLVPSLFLVVPYPSLLFNSTTHFNRLGPCSHHLLVPLYATNFVFMCNSLCHCQQPVETEKRLLHTTHHLLFFKFPSHTTTNLHQPNPFNASILFSLPSFLKASDYSVLTSEETGDGVTIMGKTQVPH